MEDLRLAVFEVFFDDFTCGELLVENAKFLEQRIFVGAIIALFLLGRAATMSDCLLLCLALLLAKFTLAFLVTLRA
ncbi:hypothetical protein YM304_01130 [Ilumatobacter coccineus YM16-304]|uniref:Uncharacterized protein n=1 Tax=Ilumatobacter coccineus (strain NBRC 103263 / KCTC 29153 / YM16-304) TaxID=1313172 RepID=A0A6C7DYT5_ILUCY|nr:hypothetical protein YM304_01130 [Ilumatobacter coccineus YM16-304]